MDALIKVMAFIGFVVIIIYLIYRFWNYFIFINNKRKNASIRPPLEYMNNIGIKCPDYWTYKGISANGNYICENTFDLPFKNNNKECYTDSNSKITEFGALSDSQNWQDMSEDDRKNFIKTSKASTVTTTTSNENRCAFTQYCQSVWLGVQNQC